MRKLALLVVDVQTALVKDKPFKVREVIENIKTLVNLCRKNNVEVIYVQHNSPKGTSLEPNSPGWQIYSKIAPLDNEKVISKNFNSAFKKTSLKSYLDSKNITDLIIVGMQTEYCIDSTCKVAFEYGYNIIMPELTNTTFDNDFLKAEDIYNHYNFSIFKDRFAVVENLNSTLEKIFTK